MAIRVLIVDDHVAVSQGMKAVLEHKADMIVTVLSSALETMKLVKEEDFDVILLDLHMPELNGMELAQSILHEKPESKIVVWTGFDLATHMNLLIEVGVYGFISKASSTEDIMMSITAAARGLSILPVSILRQLTKRVEGSHMKGAEEKESIHLTEKDQKMLKLIAEGLTNREIAEALYMSQRAVEYALTRLFGKLGARSRTEALMKAKQYGLVSFQTV